jgi:DNA-binding transcriptional LysR family regulator
MTLRHATVRQLQIFREAAQALSFATVARRLHLTPAAVSFQIKQIEEASGFPLFERIGKKVVLTEAGRALNEYALTILRALDDADQYMASLRGIDAGTANIGLVSTAKYIAPELLARFQADHPGITISLREGNRRQVLEFLERGDVDLAVMGQPPRDAGVEATPFAPHPTVMIAPPSHPLVGRRYLGLRALAKERFVVREEGSGTRALMDRYFAAAGFKPRIAMASTSNETIKQAVIAGMGIALLSRHTVGLELRMQLLSTLDVEGLPLMRQWFVAHREAMPLLPIHRQLKAFLIEEGETIIANANGSG